MRFHRFYVPKMDFSVGQQVEISLPSHLHQWRDVFRFGVGDEVILFNGMEDNDYRARFILLTKTLATVEIVDRLAVAARSRRKVNIYLMIVKKEAFEWVVQKTTEVGVNSIVPVISEHTQVKDINRERTEKIIIEAVEQSGWCRLPLLEKVMNLETALGTAKNPVICDIEGTDVADKVFAGGEEASIFIGPEGGWSPSEKALFKSKNLPMISFGTFTLRAETAAIIATALATLQMNPSKT